MLSLVTQPLGITTLNAEFQRIKRLPPYVFNIVNDLKAQARARGEEPQPFWDGWLRLKQDYDRRLPPE